MTFADDIFEKMLYTFSATVTVAAKNVICDKKLQDIFRERLPRNICCKQHSHDIRFRNATTTATRSISKRNNEVLECFL